MKPIKHVLLSGMLVAVLMAFAPSALAQIQTGTRQGLAISWPGHIKDVGSIRPQFHHVIDIVPTILEACGIREPREIR